MTYNSPGLYFIRRKLFYFFAKKNRYFSRKEMLTKANVRDVTLIYVCVLLYIYININIYFIIDKDTIKLKFP